MMVPYAQTKEGFESEMGEWTFHFYTLDSFQLCFRAHEMFRAGVNHIAHFVLTTELLDLIERDDTLVVNLSSRAHMFGVSLSLVSSRKVF